MVGAGDRAPLSGETELCSLSVVWPLPDTVPAFVKIYVDTKCVYWLPNIFSPNGDAQNDELKIYGRGLEWIYLSIFDRWGNRVFESSDVNAT